MKKIACTYRTVDDLIARYIDAGGHAIQLDEGCLQSGEWILYDDTGSLKCFYIFERYLNEWSADQVICQYPGWDKFPKKYRKKIAERIGNDA